VGITVCLVPLDPSSLNASVYGYGCHYYVEPLSPTANPSTVSVPVTSQNTSVGTITSSPVTFTAGVPTVMTSFHAVGLGTTQINLGQTPGFSVPSNYQTLTASVTEPQLYVGDVAVGQNLQTSTSVCGALNSTNVTISISDPSYAVLSSDSGTQGQSSLTVPLGGANGSCATIWVQGRQTPSPGTDVTINAVADSYQTATAAVTVNPSGFVLPISQFGYQPDFFTTTTSADQTLSVYPGMLDPVTKNLIQTQILNPNVTANVNVYASQTCGGTNGSNVGQILPQNTPLTFTGPTSAPQIASFHVDLQNGATPPASAVIWIPAPAAPGLSPFSQASDNNCITANVTQ
jgi:hypothetical protein